MSRFPVGDRQRPNIVLIMADQWACDSLGATGNATVLTPHIDEIAASGVLFDTCYCNAPLCVPARGCLLTGRYASRIGMYDNASELPASEPTFVHHLRLAGYDTVLTGKMHFIGPDQHHGFETRLLTDIYPATFALTPDWSRGVYPNPGSSIGRITNSGPCGWNVQLEYDSEVVHTACQYLRRRATDPDRSGKPLFLCASFTHPHDPFEIPQPFWDLYEGVDIPPPAAPACDDLHEYNRWIQIHHEAHAHPLTDEQIARARRAYYGMVSHFDRHVGEIVRALAETGLLDNTLIIVTSDHGEMLGEHGMWFKRTFYENAVRVPLVVSWPGVAPAGGRRHETVSLVDLAATLLAVADVPDSGAWRARMDGESFHQLLYSSDRGWKDEAFCEYYGEGPREPFAMLRSGAWKCVEFNGLSPVLYDLARDPNEINDRAADPQCREVLDRLRADIRSRVDLTDMARRVRESQERRLMVHRALTTGTTRLWALEDRFFV